MCVQWCIHKCAPEDSVEEVGYPLYHSSLYSCKMGVLTEPELGRTRQQASVTRLSPPDTAPRREATTQLCLAFIYLFKHGHWDLNSGFLCLCSTYSYPLSHLSSSKHVHFQVQGLTWCFGEEKWVIICLIHGAVFPAAYSLHMTEQSKRKKQYLQLSVSRQKLDSPYISSAWDPNRPEKAI